jgi:hypothetical protein
MKEYLKGFNDDEELACIKRFGQALDGGVTPFDEAVEYYLNRYERAAKAAKRKGASRSVTAETKD